MVIAIDIDNTLFTSNSIVYKVLNKVQKVGKPGAKKLTFKTVDTSGKVSQSFLKLIFPVLNPKKFEPLADALETLDEWKKQGHEIVLLTNRPASIKAMKNATVALLQYHNVNFDKLVMGCKNKHLFCKEYGIPLLIDDNKQNCENVVSKGLSAIRICEENKGNNPNGNMFHVSNWKGVRVFVNFVEYKNIYRPPHTLEGAKAKREELAETLLDPKLSIGNYDEIIIAAAYDPKKYLMGTTKFKTPLTEQIREIVANNTVIDKNSPDSVEKIKKEAATKQSTKTATNKGLEKK